MFSPTLEKAYIVKTASALVIPASVGFPSLTIGFCFIFVVEAQDLHSSHLTIASRKRTNSALDFKTKFLDAIGTLVYLTTCSSLFRAV
jgi:hypothetical protein